MRSEGTAKSVDRRLVIVSLIGLVAIWQIASLLGGRSPLTGQRLVPGPLDLVHSFHELAPYWPGGLGVETVGQGGRPTFGVGVLALIDNSLASVIRLMAGIALGTFISVALAATISWSRTVQRMFAVPAHVVRMFPLLALAPLFNLWFGSTERGAIFFVALSTFAILFILALTAIANVPNSYVDYARSLGASRTRAYFTVVLPASLPALRGGALLAVGFGWSSTLAAEFLGQNVGLGNIVNHAQQFGQTNLAGVVGVSVMIYGALSYALAARIFDYWIRWAE